jgi:large subunit ribosomal protein L25
MSDVLDVKLRGETGTSAAKKIRRAGRIPAVLYGHGRENVSLTVGSEQFLSAIRHGGKVVDLRGDLDEKALIRDVQWDTFGANVLHFDLARVDAGERVRVTLPIELRGEAPGVKEGGVVSHVTHQVDIECPIDVLPERIEVNLNALHLGHAIKMAELTLPEGAKLLSPADEVVVACGAAIEVSEEATVAEAGEPEVIGRKVAEEEAEE